MNADQFAEVINNMGMSVDKLIEEKNQEYNDTVIKYINENAPYKIGAVHTLTGTGMRSDLVDHMARKRGFVIREYRVTHMANNKPILMARGDVMENTNSKKVLTTFTVVISGMLAAVEMKEVRK